MKTLKDVKVGETATVAKLHGEGPVKRRIMDMGITKGVEIYVRKVAPLGDPMELTVRNYELSVRKADAEKMCIRDRAPPAWQATFRPRPTVWKLRSRPCMLTTSVWVCRWMKFP